LIKKGLKNFSIVNMVMERRWVCPMFKTSIQSAMLLPRNKRQVVDAAVAVICSIVPFNQPQTMNAVQMWNAECKQKVNMSPEKLLPK
jgi:hypothetical protein